MNPLIGAMNGGSRLSSIPAILSLMKGKSPEAAVQLLAQQNPQFRDFARKCQGKTMEQVAAEYGVDLSQVKQLMK